MRKVVVLKDNKIVSRSAGEVCATNYGTDSDPDWYAEFRDTEGQFRYVKQKVDGFDVVVLETDTAWEEFVATLKATNEALYDVFDVALSDYITNILEIPGVSDAVMAQAQKDWSEYGFGTLYNQYGITDLKSLPWGYLWALAWKEVT